MKTDLESINFFLENGNDIYEEIEFFFFIFLKLMMFFYFFTKNYFKIVY